MEEQKKELAKQEIDLKALFKYKGWDISILEKLVDDETILPRLKQT